MYDKKAAVIDHFHSGYDFLSNFSPAKIIFEGMGFPTVEHAYQAAKTLNKFERETIRDAVSPGKAKRLGKLHQLREDWECVKVDIMRDLIRQKFSDKHNAALLLDTGVCLLVEGNYWGDRFWGVCDGVGQNWLGRILMEQRKALREA